MPAPQGIDLVPEPGEFRHQVAYQTNSPTQDSYGKQSPNWTTQGIYFASIRQLSGREAVNAERLKITASHVVRTRCFGGATAAGRLLFGSRVFNIASVNNVNEMNVVYEFMATEVVNPPQ